MSLIEFHPDLRRTNELLERIACAAERLLLEQYGVRMGHTTEPASDPNPSEKPTVGYATDEDTARRKVEQAVRAMTEEEEREAWNDNPPEEWIP